MLGLLRYLMAILLPLAGAVIRFFLLQPLESRAAFITFYPVVVIVALIGGAGPGTLATFLSALLASVFWLEPVNHIRVVNAHDWITLVIFVLSSLGICVIVEAMKRAQARVRQAQAESQRADEQRRAEASLRQSEERFRLMFDQATIGKIIIDCDLRTLRVNDAVCRFLGYSRDELMNTQYTDYTHPEDVPADLAQTRALLEGVGEGFELDKRYVRKDGRVVWAHLSVDAIRDPGGKPLFLFGLVQDINERKLAMEEVARTNARLRLLLDALPVGVVIAEDADCRVITANPAASRFFEIPHGVTLSATSPHNPSARYFHRGRALAPEEMPLQLAVFGNREVPAMEVDAHMASGRRWIGLISATPLHDTGGRVMGGLAVVQDISERKHDEESLKQYADDLGRSNQELQQFLYIASHDFQEPLRMVSAFGELLRDANRGRLDPKSTEYIELSIAASQRAIRLVNDLLEYSRIGSKPCETRAVSLDQALDDALRELGSVIQESGATVERSPLPVVQANPGLVRQVFRNLIENAIRYRKPDLKPVIRIASDGNRVSISDNGIGIDPQYHKKIFDAFQRLHTNEQYEGSGLGLTICKRIIDHYGGTIGVDSRLGQGSTFYVTFSPAP